MSEDVEFEEKLRQLQETYRSRLAGDLDQLLQLQTKFSNGPDRAGLENIRQLAHALAGSGATFGFQEISTYARLLEKLCQSIDPVRPDDPHLRQMGTLVGQIIGYGTNSQPAARAPVNLLGESPREEPALVVIDPDIDLATNVSDQLSFFGYTVRRYSSPADYLSADPAHSRPAAILVDALFIETVPQDIARISETTGGESNDAPALIFLSGYGDFDARLGAIRAGGEGFFRKPVDIHNLVDRLDSITRRHLTEPYRVLIVDDDPVLAHHHALILHDAGLIPRTLEHEHEFLEVVEDFQPDLILMDLHLKYFDGFTLARIIEQHDQYFTTPVVFLSTEINIQQRFRAFEAGGENFLTKPITPQNLVRSVFHRAKRARKARTLRTRDSLTGLLNFAAIEEALREKIAESQEVGFDLGVALIDIDFFKKVNDTYGHAAGDRVLQTFGRFLRERFRTPDQAGRHGGEEFLILLPGATPEDTYDCMIEIKNQFQRIEFPLDDGESFRCTLSCGVTDGRSHANPMSALQSADEALYRAKETGRDKIVIQTAEDS